MSADVVDINPADQAQRLARQQRRDANNSARVARAERRRRILTLAAGGADADRIAEVIGTTPKSVRSVIGASLTRYRASDLQQIEQVRVQQLQRLDAMLLSIWPKVTEGNLKAIDRALKIEQQRARITGIDDGAPDPDPGGGENHVHLHVDPGEIAKLEQTWQESIEGHAVELPAGPDESAED